MNVTVGESYDFQSGTMIDAVIIAHINLDEGYINATYESCRHVVHPASGRKAIALACGGRDEHACTARYWYQFMGDPELNPEFVPFLFDYRYDETHAERTLRPTTLPCNEAYAGEYGCSCVDCPATCPAAGTPPANDDVPTVFQVAGLNGITFVLSIVFGVMGIVIVSIMARRPSLRFAWRVPSCFAGVPAVTDGLTAFFGWWGRSCARHPVLTLAVCSWLIAGLAFGAQYLVIVTDPVELWAAPASQTRQEKDYFDERFGPFYRTAQVFVKARYTDTFQTIIGGANLTFGPAFERKFMADVFRMQRQLEQLGVDDGEGLEHVCFALVPEMDDADDEDVGPRKKCLVQSALGYFGNAVDILNNDRYLHTLDMCIASPLSPDCLAPYGGPAEPGIVFGGQPKAPNGLF